MKLTVPYTYTFWYVPTRCTNDRHALSQAVMEVEIAEIDDADAPVVMTVANGKDAGLGNEQGADRFLPRADGKPRQVRMRNGLFYVEAMSAEELSQRASRLATLDATFLAKFGISGQRTPGYVEKSYGHSDITSVSGVRRQNGGLREDKTRDDRGEKVGRLIARQAARMFIVDGVTFELCREPVLKIKFDHSGLMAHGIVEAFESLAARTDYSKYSETSAYTSSLIHADHLLSDMGVEKKVSFEVIDHNASSYDGVASDIAFHLVRAESDLKGVVHAAPTGVLQAYYKVAEALRHIDRSSPSISAEVIAAAHSVMDISVDPEIDEPMQQLSRTRFMNDRSGRQAVLGPDHGGPFRLDLMHVGGYRDRQGKMASATAFAGRILDRWEGRHPGSTFDNGQTDRMTTTLVSGVTVAEIGSDAQARHAAWEIGLAPGQVEKAIASGSRLFRLSAEKMASKELSRATRAGMVGLVIGPAPGDPNGHWSVAVKDHPKAEIALDAVSQHVEAMDERDMEMAQDQQLISIF
ncbi:hypothetical protein [Rhizobium sp. BK176]|uniref:hypothetical protein n=1 Tax=Rhizobium sp. BK176 TaxID=2587071 RepID=UPI0021691598|nr:hypothetical protein [Rhizobium sp. BK176]MCS4088892.1 hypothetical protein [Rhizobium sp. BK176]